MLVEKQLTGRWDTYYLEDTEGNIVMKECRTCFEVKEIDRFYEAKDCLGGRRSSCIECENERNREYHRNDKPKSAARKRRWRSHNTELANNTARAWRMKNKERVNNRRKMYAANTNRISRNFGLPTEFTTQDKEELYLHFGGCALTGDTKNIHYDHVIPVSLGVGGSYKWNILPMKSSLNISKGNKNIFEWFESNKDRFNLDESKFDEAIKYLANQKGVTSEEYKDFIYQCFNIEEEEA